MGQPVDLNEYVLPLVAVKVLNSNAFGKIAAGVINKWSGAENNPENGLKVAKEIIKAVNLNKEPLFYFELNLNGNVARVPISFNLV